MTNVCLYIFCLFVIVSCIGCDKIGGEDEIDFYGPIWIESICISKDRPAEVLIGVNGLGGTGCGNRSFKNIYVDRVENTINIRPTTTIDSDLRSGEVTCSAIDDFYGEVTLKDLDVGEYEITLTRVQGLRLRIEKETASALLRPRIEINTVEMKTSEGIQRFDSFPDPLRETTETVQVTIHVEGFFAFGSHFETPPKITYITPPKITYRGGADISIAISGEVGFADCMQDRNLTRLPHYDAEIDLGLFEAGDYRVHINGDEVQFSIRLPK